MAIPLVIRRAVQTRQYAAARPKLWTYTSGRLQERAYRAALPALLLLDMMQWDEESAESAEPLSYLRLMLAVAEQESRWLGVVLLAHYLAWLGRRTRVIAGLEIDGVVAQAYDEQWRCPTNFAALWQPVVASAKPHDPRPLLLARELGHSYAEIRLPAHHLEAVLAGCEYLVRAGEVAEARQWLAEGEGLLAEARTWRGQQTRATVEERYRSLRAMLAAIEPSEQPRVEKLPLPKAIRRAVQTRRDERAIPGLQRYVAHSLKRGALREALTALLLLDLIQREREPADHPPPPVHLKRAMAIADRAGRWLGLLLGGFYLSWLGRHNRMSVILLLDALVGWTLRQALPGPPSFLPLFMLASQSINQDDSRIRLLLLALEQGHAEGGKLGDRFHCLLLGCHHAIENRELDEARAILKRLEALHAATPPDVELWPPSLVSRTQLYPREERRVPSSKQTPWEYVAEGIRLMHHMIELTEAGNWPLSGMR